jgi:hypothetical protein
VPELNPIPRPECQEPYDLPIHQSCLPKIEGHPVAFLCEQLPECLDVLALDSSGDTNDDKFLAVADSFHPACQLCPGVIRINIS